MKKQRRIINSLVFAIVLALAYITFFPGREGIKEEIKSKHFSNISINKLFKVKQSNERKYFSIKDKKTIILFELDESTNVIQKETILAFDTYWFTEKNQGIDTYLVLLKESTKTEILLFDNDIRPLSDELQ